MEAGGGKDCEEDTLQTAFKKLRVDAESLPAAVTVSESSVTRVVPRACPELGGAKPKLSCPKENWHGCMRKSSRAVVRSQRRRRSKSPILHPPKFTYCSSKMAPPAGQIKQQRLAVDLDTCSSTLLCGAPPRKEQLLASGHAPSPVFGASGYEPLPLAASASASPDDQGDARPEGRTPGGAPSDEESGPETGACAGADPVIKAGAAAGASDFQALSQLQEGEGGPPCPGLCCEERACRCRCPGWRGVEVYAFTGLRDVISECERNLASPPDAAAAATQGHAPPHHRTHPAGSASPNTTATTTMSSSSSSGGSPRSCSEQARAYVDDITIEDLSGYMEYYLYIPKKMSHMAEMMYT